MKRLLKTQKRLSFCKQTARGSHFLRLIIFHRKTCAWTFLQALKLLARQVKNTGTRKTSSFLKSVLTGYLMVSNEVRAMNEAKLLDEVVQFASLFTS